jgi:predicted O-methyltransferase YrrM
MTPINKLSESIQGIESVLKNRGGIHTASVDLCHGMFMLGTLMSAKPENVLELGIGPGFASEVLVAGIRYNGTGQLTCVDNLTEVGGNTPTHTVAYLESNGVNVVAPVDEFDFVMKAEDEEYDFLVSDADHARAHLWAEKVFDMMKPKSFMFFHDIVECPNLLRYKEIADERGYYNHIFSESSRNDERCHRGWLFIIKS